VRNLDGELKMSPDNHVLGTPVTSFSNRCSNKGGGACSCAYFKLILSSFGAEMIAYTYFSVIYCPSSDLIW
jgi:hypothetical protein